MRFAFLSTMAGSAWGGSEELWHRTALALVARGHSVFCSMFRNDGTHPRIGQLNQSGVEFRAWDRKRKMIRLMSPAQNPKIITDWKPDLVVLSLGYFNEGQPWMEALRAANIPFAVIVHASGEGGLPRWDERPKASANFNAARAVYFVSEANRDQVCKFLLLKPQHVAVVRNPYLVSLDTQIPWPAEDGITRLACVARLDYWSKGQDLLIEVLARPHWRDKPIELNFFGTGHDHGMFESMVSHFGLTNVRFAGHVESITSVWENHHALLMGSRIEGLPLAVVEAMICARPVIVPDTAGNAEVVTDEVTGFLAGGPSARQIDLALQRAWKRRAEWQQIGLAAAESIRQIMPASPGELFADELETLMRPAVAP